MTEMKSKETTGKNNEYIWKYESNGNDDEGNGNDNIGNGGLNDNTRLNKWKQFVGYGKVRLVKTETGTRRATVRNVIMS